MLKKKAHIVSAIKNRSVKKTHMFGIKVPHTVEEAYELDQDNNNHY